MKNTIRRIGSGVASAFFIANLFQPVGAIENGPLPAFTATAADGTLVASGDLSAETQYVLVYVKPNCQPCDRVLSLIKAAKSPQFTSRVVVVVNGDVSSGARYVARLVPPEAGPLTWYADSDGSAYRALRMSGAPMLVGVKGGRVMWSIAGVLNDAATVESVVRTWVTY